LLVGLADQVSYGQRTGFPRLGVLVISVRVPRVGGRRGGLLSVGLLGAGMLLTVAACGSGGSTVGAVQGSAPAAGAPGSAPAPGKAGPAATVPANQDPGPAKTSPAGAEASRTLPNLVGKGLQVAQDRVQAAGFRRMTSHDATGGKRLQLFDRDWKVCFQYPTAGRRSADTRIDFGAVKLEERCPGTDKGNTAARRARQFMPDLRGKSAANAIASLILNASISWHDGTGAGRAVLLPTNWKVCAQSPKPGVRYDGLPVTLTVVKLNEKC
jgi:hypothetical protein